MDILLAMLLIWAYNEQPKDVEAEEKVKGPSTVNNALFVGSTADLAKMLKHGLKEDNK